MSDYDFTVIADYIVRILDSKAIEANKIYLVKAYLEKIFKEHK